MKNRPRCQVSGYESGMKVAQMVLVYHSDWGSQYRSQDYQILLEEFHKKDSLSRRGNSYDNTPIEIFSGGLKKDIIYHQYYATKKQANRK